MTKLAITKDINGVPVYVIDGVADIKRNATLTAASEATITVPGGSFSSNFVVVIRYEAGTSVWFALNATAAVPVGNTFASTNSSGPNYPGTKVKTGDVLHFITANTTADVGVEFYEF